MEARYKLGSIFRRPIIDLLNKSKYFSFMNIFQRIFLNKSKLLFGITGGFFLNYLNIKNKLFCTPVNEIPNSDLERRIKVIQYNANTPCEDRFIAMRLKNINANIMAVFDGHGGDSASDYASEKMAQYFDKIYLELNKKNIKNEKTQDEIIKQAFLDTFHKIESELLERAKKLYSKGEGKKACCGSCALVMLATNEKIYIAQLGDSKAKLYRKIDKRIMSQGLSRTYNSEKAHQQLHLFKSFTDLDIVVCKRDLNKSCYVKGRLQPTRSFGDFHLKSIYFNRSKKDDTNFKSPVIPFNGPYISAVPDIKTYNIDKNDYAVILATDGFWDNFKSDDVAKFLEKQIHLDSNKLINALLKESLKRAATSSNISLFNLVNLPDDKKRKTYDDTTIIFYKIQI